MLIRWSRCYLKMLITLPSLFYTLHTIVAYKILVYSPSISRSHLLSNAKIADTLALDGHDVTLLEVHHDVELGVLNASRHAKVWRQSFEWPARESNDDWQAFIETTFREQTSLDAYYNSIEWNNRYIDACKYLLKNDAFIDKLRASRYDVFIGEQLVACGSGLSHVANIKIHLWVSSCPVGVHVQEILGLPWQPAWQPAVYESLGFSDQESVYGRLLNTWHNFLDYHGFTSAIDQATKLFRDKFGPNFPDIRTQIVARSPLVFASVSEFIDFPRPTQARIINIGGLGLRDIKLKPLNNTPFDVEMRKGRLGVVYFSLGSLVPPTLIPKPYMTNVFHSLGSLADYHVILRVDEETEEFKNLAAQYTNIYLTTWAPQNELLAHDRLKLFITHGGYGSLMESARFGVPLVVMGVFGDQIHNALMVERNGWGRAFYRLELLKGRETFTHLVNDVLTNKTVQANARRIQNLLRTQPQTPEQRLTQNVRFLEANDGRLPELTPSSVDMNTLVLHNVEVWALLGGLIAFIGLLNVGFVILVLRLCSRSLSSNRKTNKRKAE